MSRSKERELKRTKSRRTEGLFLAFPLRVLSSVSLANLSPYAAKLLFDICSQYKYGKNGDLSAAWTLMQKRGWRSKDTLNKALKELCASGLIVLTRQGGLHRCSLYAVGWLAIDHCDGKLDANPTTRPTNRWMDFEPMPQIRLSSTPSVPKSKKDSVLSTGNVPVGI